MPEKEANHLTPATRLLEKRREMAEVEQALSSQKEVKTHCNKNCTLRYFLRSLNYSPGISAKNGDSATAPR